MFSTCNHWSQVSLPPLSSPLLSSKTACLTTLSRFALGRVTFPGGGLSGNGFNSRVFDGPTTPSRFALEGVAFPGGGLSGNGFSWVFSGPTRPSRFALGGVTFPGGGLFGNGFLSVFGGPKGCFTLMVGTRKPTKVTSVTMERTATNLAWVLSMTISTCLDEFLKLHPRAHVQHVYIY